MASDRWGRRAFLTRTGATATVAAGAGCLGWGDGTDGAERETDTEDGGESESGDDADPVVDEAETTSNDTNLETWADVSEIRLDAFVGGWVGVEPSHIDRVENPTLVLVEGREYEFTCENRDNVKHNLAIHDDDDEVVAELSTGVVADTGATETLSFEATPKMVTYICEHQPVIQLGDIEVVDASAID